MGISYDGKHWKSERTEDENMELLAEEIKHLSEEERAVLLHVMSELQSTGTCPAFNDVLDLEYEVEPVSPKIFIEDEYYLGRVGKDLRPRLKEDFISLFSGNYVEVILCLHPDTPVPLLDGTTPTIADLADRWMTDEKPFWIYAYDNDKMVPALARCPKKTGEDDYYRVILDDGRYFVGNSRHQMIMRDGTKRMIRDMSVGDELVPFNSISDARRVSSIVENGRGAVYCLNVPDYGNFAIATRIDDGEEVTNIRRSGVFSSNTGALGW